MAATLGVLDHQVWLQLQDIGLDRIGKALGIDDICGHGQTLRSKPRHFNVHGLAASGHVVPMHLLPESATHLDAEAPSMLVDERNDMQTGSAGLRNGRGSIKRRGASYLAVGNQE